MNSQELYRQIKRDPSYKEVSRGFDMNLMHPIVVYKRDEDNFMHRFVAEYGHVFKYDAIII